MASTSNICTLQRVYIETVAKLLSGSACSA
jgi:hypothetical protein